jgi:hypothetical protein
VGAALIAILLTVAILMRRRNRESKGTDDDMKYEPSRQFESSMSGMTVAPMLASAHADRMSYAKGNAMPVSVTSLQSHSGSADRDSGPYRDDDFDDDAHRFDGGEGGMHVVNNNPRHSDPAWPLTPGVITIPPANYKPQPQIPQQQQPQPPPQTAPQQQQQQQPPSSRLSAQYANAPLPALPPSAHAQDQPPQQRTPQHHRLSQMTTSSALVSPLTPTPSILGGGGLTRSNTIDSDAPPPPVPPLLPMLRIPATPSLQQQQQHPRGGGGGSSSADPDDDDDHQTERTPLAGATPIPDVSPTVRRPSPDHSPVSPISPVSQMSRQVSRAGGGGGGD